MTKSKKEHVDVENAEIVKREEYVKVLEKIVKEGMCPFCEEHLMNHHTEPILHKGEHWLVTKNAWPYEGTKHHFLLISRTHIENIEDISSDAWTELHKHWGTLKKEHSFEGGTFFVRSGNIKMTGATVRHLHANIVVGKKRDDKTESVRTVIGFK